MDERTQVRRTHFKLGLATDETAQDKRRREALEVQRARRSHALDSIRGIEELADFCLTDNISDCESEGKYDDVEEEEAPTPAKQPKEGTDRGQSKSGPRVTSRKYRRFRDRCMRAEFLDFAEGLPAGFENEWIMVGPVPEGKRCLAVSLPEPPRRSTYDGNTTTVVLLSRKNAEQIGEFGTTLPPNCILDCIYDRPNHTLWILDLLKWKDQAMIDCEASFRFWWRDAKLSEHTPQPQASPTSLVCSPIPARSSFSPAQVCEIAQKMGASPTATSQVVVTRSENPPHAQTRDISYACDGLLFYLKSATYESGESVLAGWVPLQVSAEHTNRHGIARLKWLCEENSDDQQQDKDDEMQG